MTIFPHQITSPVSTCVFCGSLLVVSGRRVKSHSLRKYGFIECCDNCYQANDDGWSQETGKILLKIIKERNLAIPVTNSRGLLPRD